MTKAAAKSANQSFLTGVNAEYISHLYSRYLVNPEKVSHDNRSNFVISISMFFLPYF